MVGAKGLGVTLKRPPAERSSRCWDHSMHLDYGHGVMNVHM